MRLKQVKAGEIIIGRPITQDAYDKEGGLLLRKGYVIESEKQLAILLDRGLFHTEFQPGSEQESHQSPFELLDGVQNNLIQIFSSIGTDIPKEFKDKIKELGRTIQQVCRKDIEAAIGTIFMGSDAKYTIRHPVHIALLCELFTKQLKWPDNERLSLLAAALTSNIGMLNLQEKLYYQEAPLTDEQRQQIRDHPERALQILKKAGVTDEKWLDGVLRHHESLDGSGYPDGKKGEIIPVCAQIITLGDHYCAGVSGRAYRPALSPDEVMRQIYLKSGNRIESDLVNMFVKLMGVYPPGTIVRLVNYEIAVVTQRGEKAHQPIVHSVVRANGQPFLIPSKRDCSRDKFAIKEIIRPDQVKINVNKYQLWGYADFLANI